MRFASSILSLLAIIGTNAQDATTTPPTPTTTAPTNNIKSNGTFYQNVSIPGPNPTGVFFNYYEPLTVVHRAPLVLLLHGCGGSGPRQYNSWNVIPQLADQVGFPVLFPSSPHGPLGTAMTKCWDIGSDGALTHKGGGDALGVISLVKWAITKYNSDKRRIFVAGQSSGAMFTQVLAGSYPDVFAAGAAVSGVPFGCFANHVVGLWNNTCAKGNITHSGAEWADIVHSAYPKYKGSYPKLQLHHGTNDTTVVFHNHEESVKEWTSVFGISDKPTSVVEGIPNGNWTKSIYGQGQLETFVGHNISHAVPFPAQLIMDFFDLQCPATSKTCFRKGREAYFD